MTLINLLKTISHSHLTWTETVLLQRTESISKSILNHKAVNHKTCHDKIWPDIVNRVFNKRWCEDSDSHGTSSSPRKTRKNVGSAGDSTDTSQCVYCNIPQTGNSEPLCEAMTDNFSEGLKQMTKDAENWVVYAWLNAVFDATAGDLCYHKTCYCKLSNQARAKKQKSEAKDSNPPYDPLVMAELISYIQHNSNAIRLSDLKKFYSQHLQQVGSSWSTINIHPTRFKEHLLQRLGGEWQALAKGRDVFSTSKATVGSLLSESISQHLSEDEAKKIVEVGLILRRQILKSQNPYSGSFTSTCLTEPVPNSLLTLLAVLLDGSSSILSDEDRETIDSRVRVACATSQLLISISTKKVFSGQTLYHSREREMPLPLFMGLKLHVNNHSKSIIQEFHHLGLTVS